jgi:hypothetical protein
MSKKNQETAVLESTVTKQVEPTLEQKVETIAADTSKNVSIRIRELHALGLKYGPIQKALTAAGYKTKNGTDIRFQHVRNVILTVAKKV